MYEGKLLIIKRSDNDASRAGTWECPGGNIEFGESLEHALEREIKEETGVDVQIENILYATTFNTSPERQVVILAYHCKALSSGVTLSSEHSAYRWADESCLRTLLPADIVNDFEKYGVLPIKKE